MMLMPTGGGWTLTDKQVLTSNRLQDHQALVCQAHIYAIGEMLLVDGAYPGTLPDLE